MSGTVSTGVLRRVDEKSGRPPHARGDRSLGRAARETHTGERGSEGVGVREAREAGGTLAARDTVIK